MTYPKDTFYPQAFDGPNTESRFLGRFCDNRGRFTITTSGSSLFLIYKTSRDTAKHDFQIIYETENVVESRKSYFSFDCCFCFLPFLRFFSFK